MLSREPASFWRENVRRRHATKNFSENVQMAETSYQMLQVLKAYMLEGLKQS